MSNEVNQIKHNYHGLALWLGQTLDHMCDKYKFAINETSIEVWIYGEKKKQWTLPQHLTKLGPHASIYKLCS